MINRAIILRIYMNTLLRGVIIGAVVCSFAAILTVVDASQPSGTVNVEYADLGINDINIKFADSNIVLDIELIRPTTCSQLVIGLGVEDIEVNKRIYSPQCNIINPSRVIITYKE